MRAVVIAVLVSAAIAGCAAPAAFTLRSGSRVVSGDGCAAPSPGTRGPDESRAPPCEEHAQELVTGIIEAGDAEFLTLATRDGVVRIRREDIDDMDHPGDGAAVAGAILGAVGALIFFATVDAEGPDGAASIFRQFAWVGGVMGVVGVGLFAWGVPTAGRSYMSDPYSPTESAALQRLAGFSSTPPPGAGVGVRWTW